MRITESRLRSVIRSVIAESIDDMSSDRMGSRPESYMGMGGAPSSDLNKPRLIRLANVMKNMYAHNPIKFEGVFKRMCDAIVDCDPSLKMYCSELLRQISEGFTLNERGILDCLYHICKNPNCADIVIKCCAGVTF